MSGGEARETVTREIAGGVGVITINRPERRNALNLQAKEGIGRAVEALTADRTVMLIILTGAGGLPSPALTSPRRRA